MCNSKKKQCQHSTYIPSSVKSPLILLPVRVYNLTTNCLKDKDAYISWDCTVYKKTFCHNISMQWAKNHLKGKYDDTITVPIPLFAKLLYKAEAGEEKHCLQAGR